MKDDVKEKVSYKEQVILLLHLVQEAKMQEHWSQKTITSLYQFEKKLRIERGIEIDEFHLREKMKAFNQFLAELEHDNEHKQLLQFFKDKGLYRILYHHAKHRGIEDNGRLKNLAIASIVGLGLSALIVLLFVLATILGAPLGLLAIASGLFAAASVFVGVSIYGLVNHIFGTKASLPYFLLGYQSNQYSILRTNDPLTQGIVWGMATTFIPAVSAATVFALALSITAIFFPIASFVFPVLILIMPFIAVGAEIYAKRKAHEYAKDSHILYNDSGNLYQQMGMQIMAPCTEDRAAHAANNDRNKFGFTNVPLFCVLALGSIAALSSVSMFLPVILFSTVFMTIVPVSVVGGAIIILAAAGLYAYVNRDKQIDNRYKLDFENPNCEEYAWTLYLDEDMDLVNKVRVTIPQVAEEGPSHFSSLASLSIGRAFENIESSEDEPVNVIVVQQDESDEEAHGYDEEQGPCVVS